MRSYKPAGKNTNFLSHRRHRLNSSRELLDLGFADLLKDPANIILIEWADKIKDILPADVRWLRFSHGEKEGERVIDH